MMNKIEKIKVAILNTFIPVPSINGGAEHTRHLIKYLSLRDDVELHVITLDYKNIHYKKDDMELIMLHRIKKPFGYPLSFPLASLYIRREIDRIQPDIVHALGAGNVYSKAAALVMNKYPTVLTYFAFTPDTIKFENNLQKIKYLLFGKTNETCTISKIPNIIVGTLAVKNLISNMTNSKISVIPTGIEYEKIQLIKPHTEEKPDIFLACRLHKIKGVDILIRALKTVVKSIPDIQVYIAGYGEEEYALRSLSTELDLNNHVKFIGAIYGQEKFQYYKACKIFVAPSRWDAQTITIPEAMASGKPTIASNAGGLPDVVDDGITGLLFESENVEDLAAKIIDLLTDDELRGRMGKAALEKAKEYDWKKIVDRTVEIYREISADFHEQKRVGK